MIPSQPSSPEAMRVVMTCPECACVSQERIVGLWLCQGCGHEWNERSESMPNQTPEASDQQRALSLRQKIKAELAIHDELWQEPDGHVWTQSQRATVGEFRQLIEYVERLEEQAASDTAQRERLIAQYSGPASEYFWARVNATDDMALYSSACSLQDMEHKVLAALKGSNG